ncbi:MAG: OmpH family outer membrane protein, partial [Rikenellaceae bacterium]
GEEQSLMNYGRNMEATLQEEQGVLMNKVSFAVKEYITKFNNAKKYSLILNTNAMTSVVIAGDPALDITNEVVDGLNKEYAAEQAKTTK